MKRRSRSMPYSYLSRWRSFYSAGLSLSVLSRERRAGMWMRSFCIWQLYYCLIWLFWNKARLLINWLWKMRNAASAVGSLMNSRSTGFLFGFLCWIWSAWSAAWKGPSGYSHHSCNVKQLLPAHNLSLLIRIASSSRNNPQHFIDPELQLQYFAYAAVADVGRGEQVVIWLIFFKLRPMLVSSISPLLSARRDLILEQLFEQWSRIYSIRFLQSWNGKALKDTPQHVLEYHYLLFIIIMYQALYINQTYIICLMSLGITLMLLRKLNIKRLRLFISKSFLIKIRIINNIIHL